MHPPMISSAVARPQRGFTLVEVMISMIILALILLVSVQVLNQTQRTWKQGVTRVEQFREARMAFESITQSVRQAVLNTYEAYQYNTGTTPTVPTSKNQAPLRYMRQSELQFVTGPSSKLLPGGAASSLVSHAIFFQARLGLSDRIGYESLNRLLCGRGYFIMYSTDDGFRPAHVTAQRARFRLWEYRPPAESNTVYAVNHGQWFVKAPVEAVTSSDSITQPANTRPVAENIVALIISPQVTADDAAYIGKQPWWIAPNYAYDSTLQTNTTAQSPQGTQHMLPPRVVVTLVAIDEASARTLAEKSGAGGTMPQLVTPSLFTQCTNLQSDLQTLETNLKAQNLNYRVFTASINMRNSKWSLLR